MNLKGELPLLNKLFVTIIVVMLLFLTIGIGFGSNPSLAMAPDYRAMLVEQSTITTSQMLLFDKASLSFKTFLNNQGYKITSIIVNKDKIMNNLASRNVKLEKVTNPFDNCLEANVLATVITTNTDTYYFKSSSDALILANELEENGIKFTTEQKEINYKNITKSGIIEQEIESLREKKAAADAAKRAEKAKQVSRSSINRSVPTAAAYSFPLETYKYVSSAYGYRHGKLHTGIDLAADKNTNVKAWKSGTIIYCGWNGNYGKFIEIQHNDGTYSRYAHLNNYAVNKGDIVSQGQIIAYVGTTGNSTGYHLHFEIKNINKDLINPTKYIGL